MDILVAEDDHISRRILEVLLEKWGHTVVSTEDGRKALAILSQEDGPRLAILDWMMPGVDGLEVCRRLRAEVDGGRYYLVLVTARHHQEDIVEGLAAGADDYVVKPYQHDELQARVEVGVRILTLQQELADRVVELEDALEHVRTLQGLLPICMHCHKIRHTEEHWEALETYLSNNTDAQLSHSLCPDCFKEHYGKYLPDGDGDK